VRDSNRRRDPHRIGPLAETKTLQKISLAATLALMITGTPATALNTGSVDASDRAGDKVVCRSKPKTGTRFRTKTCRTVAEWEAIREAARRTMSEELQGRAVNTCRDDPGRCH
jgi:hypothetical protein